MLYGIVFVASIARYRRSPRSRHGRIARHRQSDCGNAGRQGATVIGTATTEQGAAAITGWLSAFTPQSRGAVLDVGNDASVEALFASLDQAPEILVNNAGITRDNLLMRMKAEEWNDVVSTNLSSVYRMSKACLRGMMKARYGRIINIGSVVGLMGNAGQTNYAAAKAGMIGFTKSLAREIASRNITVNVVAPGFIDTDMTKALDEKQVQALREQIPLARLGSERRHCRRGRVLGIRRRRLHNGRDHECQRRPVRCSETRQPARESSDFGGLAATGAARRLGRMAPSIPIQYAPHRPDPMVRPVN